VCLNSTCAHNTLLSKHCLHYLWVVLWKVTDRKLIFGDGCFFAIVENQPFSWHERNLSERSAGEESESHAQDVREGVQYISALLVVPSRVSLFFGSSLSLVVCDMICASDVIAVSQLRCVCTNICRIHGIQIRCLQCFDAVGWASGDACTVEIQWWRVVPIRHDTRCYFYARSAADMSQLHLPHATNN